MRRNVCKIPHNGCEPHPDLKGDRHNLDIVAKQDRNSGCPIGQAQHQDEHATRIVKQLEAVPARELSVETIQHIRQHHEEHMYIKRRTRLYNREDLNPKHNLLDKIAVFHQRVGAAGQRIVEIEPWNQPCQHPQNKGNSAVALRLPESDLKDKPVHQDGNDRLNQCPENSHIGTGKLLSKVILCQCHDQFSFCYQIFQHA